MRNAVLIGMLLVATLGCQVSQSDAEDVLQDEGYQNVQVTGWAPFSCSEDDEFKSSFTATRTVLNPDGSTSQRDVQGTICCGWFKDCTVRH
jgi:hypothetical protein